MSLAKRVLERKLAGQAFDFAAAAARAETEAAVVESGADEGAEPDAPEAQEPDPHAAAGGSIARRHAMKILARTRTALAASGIDLILSGNNDGDDPAEIAAARIRQQLDEDRRRLKAIMSTKHKIELKRDLVLNYDAWCQGVLSAALVPGAKGVQDEVLVTAMIWKIDIGDYASALPLVEYILRWNLQMPGHWKSTAAVFVVESVADAAITAYSAGGDAATNFPAGVLAAVEDLTVDEDMHDQVRAKLQKAIGMAVIAGADPHDAADLRLRQFETLKRYLRALDLDPRAGVKQQIAQLNRDLKVDTVPGRLEQPAAAPAAAAPAAPVAPVVAAPKPSKAERRRVALEAAAARTAAAAETNPPASQDAG